MGLLKAASELYYPIRLKPAGENNLASLCQNGVNHIELRMFDLNPLVSAGVEEKDIVFAQLLMVWLAATPGQPLWPSIANATKKRIEEITMPNNRGL